MSQCTDPYGIESFKAKEKLEQEMKEKSVSLSEQTVEELKNIGEKLENLEAKLEG